MDIIAVVGIAVLLVAAVLMMISWDHPGDKKQEQHKLQINSGHRPPTKSPSPSWIDTNVALVKESLADIPGVYKEDVDMATTITQITRMATDLGIPSDEIREMVRGFEQQVEKMPTKPPETNDECPECGNLFAMVDDYLCPDCRAQA